MQTTSYRLSLSAPAEVVVRFLTERGRVLNYSIALVALHENQWHTVRVYDNRHGQNEMHRHILTGGKQPAETFYAGEFGEAMRAARSEVLAGYERMIEAWRK
jgi:hypothetical protein